MYMIVLIIKVIDWNRFANQLIDTNKKLQFITHHLDISDQVMCLYIYQQYQKAGAPFKGPE